MQKLKLKETIELFVSKAVPLVVVYNALDLMETATSVLQTLANYTDSRNAKDYLAVWDSIRGLQIEECNQKNWAMTSLGDDGNTLTHPINALERIEKMLVDSKAKGYGGAFVFYMADVLLNSRSPDRDSIAQYLMILRDRLTDSKSCIVLVGIDFDLPQSLKEHVALVSADLPTDEDYKGYVADVQDAYKRSMGRQGITDAVVELSDMEVERLGETLRGQTSFAAKQNLYLSIDKTKGISKERLRERAIHTINNQKGLHVLEGDGLGFKALGGLGGVTTMLRRLIDANRLPFSLVVFIDEIN